jgi:hypothetical protein
MNNATVSSLYCIALYDNYIALYDNYIALYDNYIALYDNYTLYISERTTVRHCARSVGTLPNKGNNNGTVLQGAFKRESLQKQTKPIRSSTI